VSTVQAIAGPRLDLRGPLPVAPLHSLLKTPGVVVVEGDDGRWLNGVNLIGYPASTPLAWNACVPEASDAGVKDEGDPGDQAQFDPFVCYLPVTCSTLSYPYIREWSETVLEATYSMAVEQALVGITQAGLGPNPSLGDGNVNVLAGGSAKSPAIALSYLENAIGLTGRRGMIHTTPAVVSALAAGGYNLDPSALLDPPGQGLLTMNGTPLVSGDGYIGATANGLTVGPGQDWMFASGPVEVRISPLVITDLRESLDRSDNVITFRAERWVLVTWDTSLQAAAKVDWDV
jgi:hypothetical protein